MMARYVNLSLKVKHTASDIAGSSCTRILSIFLMVSALQLLAARKKLHGGCWCVTFRTNVQHSYQARREDSLTTPPMHFTFTSEVSQA